MGIYNIYLVDLIPGSARRLSHFTEAAKNTIKSHLTNLFDRVCQTTQFSPRAEFLPGTPHNNELVVYFIPNQAASIVRRQGGPAPTTRGGQTWPSARGMISEVYVQSAGPHSLRIANTAFHELMHNKLDMHPQLRIINNLHNDGGMGLALRNVEFNSTLTDENIELMRPALQLNIQQFWDPSLVFARRP